MKRFGLLLLWLAMAGGTAACDGRSDREGAGALGISGEWSTTIERGGVRASETFVMAVTQEADGDVSGYIVTWLPECQSPVTGRVVDAHANSYSLKATIRKPVSVMGFLACSQETIEMSVVLQGDSFAGTAAIPHVFDVDHVPCRGTRRVRF